MLSEVKSPLLMDLRQLPDQELVVASRALYQLSQERKKKGLVTAVEVNDHSEIKDLFLPQFGLKENRKTWTTFLVTAEFAAEARGPSANQAYGYHRLLGIQYEGYQSGAFPHLPLPLSLQAAQRRDNPQRRLDSYILWLPRCEGDKKSLLEKHFWEESARILALEDGYSIVIPSMHFLVESSNHYAWVANCQNAIDFLFLLLNASCVVGWESCWTHLAAAFCIPSLTIGLLKESNYAYEYNRIIFPVEYCRIGAAQDWFADHVVSQFSRLQSQLLPVS